MVVLLLRALPRMKWDVWVNSGYLPSAQWFFKKRKSKRFDDLGSKHHLPRSQLQLVLCNSTCRLAPLHFSKIPAGRKQYRDILIRKYCGKGGAPFHICMVHTALQKNGAASGFMCLEMGEVRGHPEDLGVSARGWGMWHILFFLSLSFFFPNVKPYLEAS